MRGRVEEKIEMNKERQGIWRRGERKGNRKASKEIRRDEDINEI